MTLATFSATYSDWKLIRTRKTVQIVLELPVEKSNEAYAALGGMPDAGEEVWVAVARIDPTKIKSGDSAPDRETDGQLGRSAVSRSHKPVAADKRLAQRAGILCGDLPFHAFLNDATKSGCIGSAEDAAAMVRRICGVESRADIRPDTEAGRKFERLEGNFLGWRDHDMPAEIPA